MNENKDEEIFHYEKAKQEIENLERFDKMSDEEKQKELNLFTEQRRQESIQKYGRDIYSENRTVGSKKPIKFLSTFMLFAQSIKYLTFIVSGVILF